MYLNALKNLFVITKYQFKLILTVNFILAATFCLLTTIMFEIRYLDSYGSSFILERFISLIGIILITPLFMPEQDKNISEIVQSKEVKHIVIIILRFIISILFMALCITFMIAAMQYWHCDFEAVRFFLGTFITGFFLGVLGFTFYAVTDNVIVGFLVAFAYYLLNFTLGSRLKMFYLFSLSINSMNEKILLLGISVFLLFLLFLWMNSTAKMR